MALNFTLGTYVYIIHIYMYMYVKVSFRKELAPRVQVVGSLQMCVPQNLHWIWAKYHACPRLYGQCWAGLLHRFVLCGQQEIPLWVNFAWNPSIELLQTSPELYWMLRLFTWFLMLPSFKCWLVASLCPLLSFVLLSLGVCFLKDYHHITLQSFFSCSVLC